MFVPNSVIAPGIRHPSDEPVSYDSTIAGPPPVAPVQPAEGSAPETAATPGIVSAASVPVIQAGSAPGHVVDPDSPEAKAYRILKELAGGNLPLVRAPWMGLPEEVVVYQYLKAYQREHNIDDDVLFAIINAEPTAYDIASEFAVSAGISYRS